MDTTFWLALGSFVFSFYTYRKTLVHERKRATLDAYNKLQHQSLDHLNHYTPSQIKDIAEDVRSEEYKKLSAYIARVEHFCVGVNQKIYDAHTVYELSHGYLDGALKYKIQPILDKKVVNGKDYYANIKNVLFKMELETKRREQKKKG